MSLKLGVCFLCVMLLNKTLMFCLKYSSRSTQKDGQRPDMTEKFVGCNVKYQHVCPNHHCIRVYIYKIATKYYAREPLYSNSAVIACWLQSTSAQIVYLAVKRGNILVNRLLLKNSIAYKSSCVSA